MNQPEMEIKTEALEPLFEERDHSSMLHTERFKMHRT